VISDRTPRERVIWEFSGQYAAAHARHEANAAAERARWMAEIDQISDARRRALAAAS
jgi:hypothetical protein